MSTLAATIGRGSTGSRPAASEAGRLYYDTTAAIWYRDNGSSWDSTTPSSLTNPMTTTGDLIVGGASGTPARLAIGAAGTVLKGGTTPAWSTAGEFAVGQAVVATSENTASTSFTDLATPGPSVTVTVGASGKVLLQVCGRVSNTNATENYFGVVISGATSVAVTTKMILSPPAGLNLEACRSVLITGLTPGSTTFKMQYAVLAGTGSFRSRELIVEPVL